MLGKFGVYNPFGKWKKGDDPCDPTVALKLKEPIFTVSDGSITISALLATSSEIDFAVDQLQKDLEAARKEAKRILKAQQEKIRSINQGMLND